MSYTKINNMTYQERADKANEEIRAILMAHPG